jgi:ParB/RepB/Spo0J family partition protein
VPDPTNGRAAVDRARVTALAHAIQTQGLINPITLRRNGTTYELVAGLHRIHAYTQLGKSAIPATIHKMTERTAGTARLAENVHRSNLTPIEEAQQLHPLVEAHEQGTIGVAAALGVTATWIEDRLELLTYPASLIEALHERRISLKAAGALVRITPENLRNEYIYHAIQHGITARTAALWLQQSQDHDRPQATLSENLSAYPQETVLTTTTATCIRCERTTPLENTRPVRICGDCLAAMADPPVHPPPGPREPIAPPTANEHPTPPQPPVRAPSAPS